MSKIAIKQFNPFSFFALKEKEKINFRINTNYNIMEDMLVSMFDYTIDEKENPFFDFSEMERYLIREGQCGIAKTENDGIVVGHFAFYGSKIDYNGRQTQAIVTCKNGKQFIGTIGKDIVWVWNNNNRFYDANLQRFACMLADVDLSYIYNVKYARHCPVPIVKNSKLKKAIDGVLEKIFNEGKLEVALDSDMSMSDILGNTQKNIDILNICDVNTSDKIQNLTMLTDYLQSRLLRYYGISLTGNGKKAQQSVDEIKGYSQFSTIAPSIRYKWRKKAIEQCNELFGTDITIDYSLALKPLFEEIETMTDMDIDEDGKIGIDEKGDNNED